MKSVKRLLKKIIPRGLLKSILPLFHTSQSVFYNILFWFPARKMQVIGVTGTNGKTTTVSYIASILEASGAKVGVATTSYSQIGDKRYHNKENRTVSDPLKVFWLLRRMRWARVDWVVLEVTSHSLDQNRLWGVPFRCAVMTNLTQDHLDYHKTMDNYASAKAKLFEGPDVEFAVLNADDEWFDFYNEIPNKHKMSYGTDKSADSYIRDAKLTPKGSSFTVTLDHTVNLKFSTSLVGKFNVYNATAAITACYMLYIDKSAIVKGINNMTTVPGRMEVINLNAPYNLIIDFAHTPDGLEKVLESLSNMTKERLILVFGGTGNRDKERSIMGEIAAKYADRIILTDDEPYEKDPAKLRKDVMKGIEKGNGAGKTTEVAGRKNGIKKALDIAKKDDTVVLTGMGDYDFMKVGDEYLPWNDKKATLELLAEKGIEVADSTDEE